MKFLDIFNEIYNTVIKISEIFIFLGEIWEHFAKGFKFRNHLVDEDIELKFTKCPYASSVRKQTTANTSISSKAAVNHKIYNNNRS